MTLRCCDHEEIASIDHVEIIVDVKRELNNISRLRIDYLKRGLMLDLNNLYMVDRHKSLLLE